NSARDPRGPGGKGKDAQIGLLHRTGATGLEPRPPASSPVPLFPPLRMTQGSPSRTPLCSLARTRDWVPTRSHDSGGTRGSDAQSGPRIVLLGLGVAGIAAISSKTANPRPPPPPPIRSAPCDGPPMRRQASH